MCLELEQGANGLQFVGTQATGEVPCCPLLPLTCADFCHNTVLQPKVVKARRLPASLKHSALKSPCTLPPPLPSLPPPSAPVHLTSLPCSLLPLTCPDLIHNTVLQTKVVKKRLLHLSSPPPPFSSVSFVCPPALSPMPPLPHPCTLRAGERGPPIPARTFVTTLSSRPKRPRHASFSHTARSCLTSPLPKIST